MHSASGLAAKLSHLFGVASSPRPKSCLLSEQEIVSCLWEERAQLSKRIKSDVPRILVVKQDVNEDLYCCAPGTPHDQMVESTLLRTGPVALFTETNADYRIVFTEDTPECNIWKERATSLKWDSLEFFSSYRTCVPGRTYGQSSLAVAPAYIDWSQYDIVVSIDIAIPKSIVIANPNILWTYYVREIKTPAYQASLSAAVGGYDRVLNHCFRLNPPQLPPHVLEFPYHLQYYGCFHQLFSLGLTPTDERHGVFVDHHTMVSLTPSEREGFRAFGELASTIHSGDREIIPTSERIARRTMDPDLKERFLRSRYFLITPGQRQVFGTGLVEAIAAGALAIGSPDAFRDHGFLFSEATAASSSREAMLKIRHLESNPELYEIEVSRQRWLVDFLCFVRPLSNLLDAWGMKRSRLSK